MCKSILRKKRKPRGTSNIRVHTQRRFENSQRGKGEKKSREKSFVKRGKSCQAKVVQSQTAMNKPSKRSIKMDPSALATRSLVIETKEITTKLCTSFYIVVSMVFFLFLLLYIQPMLAMGFYPINILCLQLPL